MDDLPKGFPGNAFGNTSQHGPNLVPAARLSLKMPPPTLPLDTRTMTTYRKDTLRARMLQGSCLSSLLQVPELIDVVKQPRLMPHMPVQDCNVAGLATLRPWASTQNMLHVWANNDIGQATSQVRVLKMMHCFPTVDTKHHPSTLEITALRHTKVTPDFSYQQ